MAMRFTVQDHLTEKIFLRSVMHLHFCVRARALFFSSPLWGNSSL